MIRVKNKLIVAFLASALTISSISIVMLKDTNIVYAAESKALRDAKDKISHLTKSLKTNYLGLKNQGMWQSYIKQARDLIKKIPNSENIQRDALAIEVNKDEALVNALSRINQVEKSIQPKSEGGYGNYLGIKNAETWRNYLSLAELDLEKVDQSIFKKQYDELIDRLYKVSLVVKDIEDEFQVEYDKVIKLYEEAKGSKDLTKCKEALKEAEKLGTCDRSNKLESDIRQLINNNSDKDNIIKFPDKEFEALIRDEISKPSGDIYKSDVENIKELSFSYTGIKSINGIENFTKLESFHIFESNVSDISPLENLINLKSLGLFGGEISDISSLENLTKLEDVTLANNKISDITPLKNLTKIKELALHQNQIKNIYPLKSLINLEIVFLDENKIVDISPLKDLNSIYFLTLDKNSIKYISPLSNLSNLERLSLASNQINDISALKNLNSLEIIWLSNNKISESSIQELQEYLPKCQIIDVEDTGSIKENTTPEEALSDNIVSFADESLEKSIRDKINKPSGNIYKNDVEGITTLTLNFKSIENINGIENLINLQELSLDHNKISDITPLKTLTNLKYIALKHNKISDISPLKDLTNIEILGLNDNQISDISPLKNFINLQILVLHDNQVSDISPLKNLTNLEAIDMYDNQVSDISPLKNLIKLRDIGLYHNRISDISALSSLNNLIDVRLAFNEISDISALSNLTNLTNLDLRDNQINDISSLKGLVNLNALWLSGNKINEDDIKTLQDYLDCAVL